MDHGMLTTDAGDQHVPDNGLFIGRKGRRLRQLGNPAIGDLLENRRLDQHCRGWVRREQRTDVIWVEVIRVLVCHQDAVEIGQIVPCIGEVPRIDQDSRIVGFREYRCVSKVGDPHGPKLGHPPHRVADYFPGPCAVDDADVEMGHPA
jgi:hypothetical protein